MESINQLNIKINSKLIAMAEYFCEIREITLDDWINEKLELACHQEQKDIIYQEFLDGLL